MKKSAQRRPGRRILIGWSHYFISNEKNIPVTLIDFELMSTWDRLKRHISNMPNLKLGKSIVPAHL